MNEFEGRSNMDIETLQILIEELREIIQSKAEITSQLASRYETQIADLQDENERLTQGLSPTRFPSIFCELRTTHVCCK